MRVHGFTRKRILVPLIIIAMLAALWFIRIIPSAVCVAVAARYIHTTYPGRNFQYGYIEYSAAHQKYFVHFEDDGNEINLMTSIFGVEYDPLDPLG